MEVIRGKKTWEVKENDFSQLTAGFYSVNIDLGTGDGRYVSYMAGRNPRRLFIGVDACRDNLAVNSRRAGPNALFVAANILSIPRELRGLADSLTINFPWGSLLKGLVRGEEDLLGGLAALARPGAALEILINGGALAETGCAMEDGTGRLTRALAAGGFGVQSSRSLGADELRAQPSTWAKRVAFGRDPRAWLLQGVKE